MHKHIATDPPSPKNHLRHEPLRSWPNRRFERYGFVGNWTDSRRESGLLMFIYLFCCAMSRDNETLWRCGADVVSFCNQNFLFAKRFPGILQLCQPEWRYRLNLDMGWGHGRPEKQKIKNKICLNFLSWSHCCLYWRCGDCINKASLFLKHTKLLICF